MARVFRVGSEEKFGETTQIFPRRSFQLVALFAREFREKAIVLWSRHGSRSLMITALPERRAAPPANRSAWPCKRQPNQDTTPTSGSRDLRPVRGKVRNFRY